MMAQKLVFLGYVTLQRLLGSVKRLGRYVWYCQGSIKTGVGWRKIINIVKYFFSSNNISLIRHSSIGAIAATPLRQPVLLLIRPWLVNGTCDFFFLVKHFSFNLQSGEGVLSAKVGIEMGCKHGYPVAILIQLTLKWPRYFYSRWCPRGGGFLGTQP